MPRVLCGDEPVKSIKISSPATLTAQRTTIGSSKPSLQVSFVHSPFGSLRISARTAASERRMISSATASMESSPNSSIISNSARPPASLHAVCA